MGKKKETRWTLEGAAKRLNREAKREASGKPATPLFAVRAEVCAFMEIQAATKKDALADFWGGVISREAFDVRMRWNAKLAARIQGLQSEEGGGWLFDLKEPFGVDAEEPWRWVWFCFVKVFRSYWLEGLWYRQLYDTPQRETRKRPLDFTPPGEGMTEIQRPSGEKTWEVQRMKWRDAEESKESYREKTLDLLSQYALAFEYFRRYFDAISGGNAHNRVVDALIDETKDGENGRA